MDVKEKGQSLKLIFLEYLILIGVGLIISVSLAFFTFNLLLSNGIIIPANYTENQIIESKAKIVSTKDFDESIIPNNTAYIFLSKDLDVIKSNMSEEEQQNAIRFHNGEQLSVSATYYIEINRKDGYVVINYLLEPFYTNAFMDKYFPNVNIFFASILITFCLSSCIIITFVFAKKLTKQLTPMLYVSEKIVKQDLDFKIPYSKVREFNTVLKGLENMKSALSESLKNQWINEENKKIQISSLTHDLKTPLSIVQGNAQLLQETEITQEQKIYVEYILKNSNRIADYIQALITMNKTDKLNDFTPTILTIEQVVRLINLMANEIISTNKLNLNFKEDIKDCNLSVDVKLLERCLQNILANAVEYSPKNSTIELFINNDENFLKIEITDSGQGFSNSDLIHATEQFYRGDSSRHSDKNYGLGLYTVSKIIKLHSGQLILKNRKDVNGAVIIIKLPISKICNCINMSKNSI